MDTFRTVETHAEGAPSRIVLDAERWVRGATMRERWAFCVRELDGLRYLLLHEPRGAAALCAVFVLPPTRPDADIAIIVLEQGGFTAMSGSNTICTVTALLEEGVLPVADGPITTVVIETAVGLVRAEAHVRDGKVEMVSVHNVPSFAVEIGRILAVPGIGTLTVDVAFGGQYFVYADLEELGLELAPNNARALVNAGLRIKSAALGELSVRHPENPAIDAVSLVMLRADSRTPGISARNTVVMSNGPLAGDPAGWTGAVDRSPCGTGTSGLMAIRHAQGRLALGTDFVHEGILGTNFIGRLIGETTVGDNAAVLPVISGRGWVSGRSEWRLDPTDPFPTGFTVADVWSPTG